MADQARARKLAKRISQIVAGALEHEVADPRLSKVTITDTRVTGDLREATVYYTVLGDSVDAEPDTAGAAAALNSAKGVLRTMVGAGTGVRYTPSLTFVADQVPDTARHMEELMARTRESDAEVARLAAGARPAGDPDPYRTPLDGTDKDAEDNTDDSTEDGAEDSSANGTADSSANGSANGTADADAAATSGPDDVPARA